MWRHNYTWWCHDMETLSALQALCELNPPVTGQWENHKWPVMRSSDVLFDLNTLRPRQNDRHFPDDIFKWVFLNENVWISINISLKFVPRGSINNIPTLVQVMAWRRPGDKPLSEPMMVELPTHICVTRPQWVKSNKLLNTRSNFRSLRRHDTTVKNV